MNATRSRHSRAFELRAWLVLFLALALMPASLGAPRPASAEEPTVRDHRGAHGHIQILLKRIIVHDDLDWGDGDISLSAHIRTNPQPCPLYYQIDCGTRLVESSYPTFSASDGAAVQLNRITPAAGDTILDPSASPQLGITISPGQWYGFTVKGVELDPADDDSMGFLDANIIDSDGQIRYGTFTERGQGQCEHQPVRIDFCPAGVPAAFSVEYEIRPTPLPDFKPTAFRVAADLPGDRDDQICFTVQNRGLLASDPFSVRLTISGTQTPSFDVPASGLAAGQTREQCTSRRLPDAGMQTVSVLVDPANTTTEMDDTNNELIIGLDRTPAGQTRGPVGPVLDTGSSQSDSSQSDSSPSDDGPVIVIRAATPTAPPAITRPTQPDLTVSAIRVNGQTPDGKNDCKDGKNTVTVVMKNGGSADAESFVARLVVDGNQAEAVDLPVVGLKAGQEREITFESVRLKAGEHKLAATADPAGSLTEANKDNNARTVTASCQNAA